MGDQVVAEVAGLQISNNTFTSSPPGSLAVADNCVIPQKSVIEPVHGQARAYTMPTASQIAFALTEFQGVLIANFATGKTDTSYGLGPRGAPISAYSGGPYNPVDDDGSSTTYGRMKFGFGGSYLYFCTTSGPKALETSAGPPRTAGLLRPGDITSFVVSNSLSTAAGRWLPYGSAAAYRSVIRRATSDGVSLLSPPSGRSVVANSIVIAPGEMVRSGGALVTVTSESIRDSHLAATDTFTITPGEADFPAGSYTVASKSANVMTFNSAGANNANVSTENLDTGARETEVFLSLSPDAVAGDFIRVYRSLYTSSATVQPPDEMFLVSETVLTAGHIAAGLVAYIDVTPQSVIRDPLYTNPQTGEGSTQANFQPPLYRDIAFWGGRMWFANTTALQTLNIQMLGVGAPDGVQNNDTITFAIPGASGTPYAFTFKTSAGASPDVQIWSASTPSVNILKTAAQLIAVVNAKMVADGVPFRLYYNSAQNDAPGRILAQATSYAQTAFGVKVSRATTWTPAMNNTTSTSSDNGRVPNGLAYSKLSQSEAVPSVNFTTVGSKNYPIGRILPLQQSLLIFKEGDGIYALTGQQGQFQVLQISTANIIAPDCAAVFADSAWVYTDQGILRISDSGGATVVSRQIETELNRLRALYPTQTFDYSFAVPYEVERRIMFFVPFGTESTSGRPVLKAWCYNNATQAWSGPLYTNAFSGYVEPSDTKLALGTYDYAWATSRITLERKGQTPEYFNYANASFSNSITASDELLVTLSSLTDVEVGDGLLQGNYHTKISALRPDVGTTVVEVYENIPWANTTCTVFKRIEAEVRFQPAGAPSSRKTLTRMAWLFKPEWFEVFGGLTTMFTDQIQAELEIDTPSLGFGLNGFGQGPFGNPTPLVVDVNPIDPKWTNAAEFFPGFKLSEVWPKLRLQGYVALIEGQGAPAGRGK
jgi:hypothetical protein